MAPIKFEEHIKEQLDKREIQPSARSWEKLNARLQSSSRKEKSEKWWLPAAAAVIVLLIAGLVFINFQNEQTSPIVDTPANNSDLPAKKINQKIETPVEIALENETDAKPIKKPENTSLHQEKNRKRRESEKVVEPVETNTAIVDNSDNTEEIQPPMIAKPFENQSQEQTLLSDKINELLAEVAAKEKKGKTITDAEVDALLANAAKEVSGKQHNIDENIDAKALLADVENEMYESFKEKIFQALKEGYQKAAVAVSNKIEQNRNQ